jgi:hypothetical protein
MWNTLFTMIIVAAIVGLMIVTFPKDDDWDGHA